MSLGPPNLATTVASFAFPVTRRRYDPPAVLSSGLVQSTGYVDTTVQAHVHDATATVLERVFPGQEGTRAIQFYTSATDIRTADESTNERADSIVYRGVEFEVVEVAEWDGGPFGDRSYLAGVARLVQR